MTNAGFERWWRRVATYLSRSPGTFVFLFVIVVTTLVLRGLDAPTATRLLRRESTNLLQMSRDAPRVLFLSAFLLDGGQLWREAITFNVVLCPLERWTGTYRWLAAIAAGHVGATIATTLGIWFEVRAGAAERAIVYPVDVGP
ncbi:MAG TPA: rhomboid-like protein, partial [Acidimicrobiales bacterium]|nr:rhomboid-like protein [Acidimicrobiales bacterium]